MSANTFRYLTTAALILVLSAGCATVPTSIQGTKSGPPEAETRLSEANSALDAANEQSASFYRQLGSTIQEIREFCGKAGWNEFEQILLEYPSLRDPDSQIEITPEIEARLAGWSKRWKRSWEETLVGYLNLVDKCIILEAKRLAVRERMLAVQARFLAVVMLESSAGRDKQAKDVYAVVEMLDGAGAELNSHQPDDLGLYRAPAPTR